MRLSAVVAFILASAFPAPPARATTSPPVAFVDVTVLPMDRDVELAHRTVVVAEGRIRTIGPAGEVSIPPDAFRVDGRGLWLMPGLTDAHVHLLSREELRLYLANGVTSVFNLHGTPAHIGWRREVEDGSLAGPGIVTTGPSFARRLTPEEAAREVEAQAAAGYDAVKIYNQVGSAEYPALVAAARAKGLLVVGHVPREPGFEAVVRAGQSIVHAEELIYTALNRTGSDSPAPPLAPERIPDTVRAVARAGLFVTPTLSTYRDILRQATDLAGFLRRPELAWLPAWVRDGLAPGRNRYDGRYSAAELEGMREGFVVQRQLVRELARAGVPLLAGTDSTQIGPVAGFSIHEELAELVEAGLSPFEALRTATVNARRQLGRDRVGGVVEEGARGDLLLLSADPRSDVGNLRRIEGVLAKGRWYDGERLASLRESLPGEYSRRLADLRRRFAQDPAGFDAGLREGDPLGVLSLAVFTGAIDQDGVAEVRRRLRRLRLDAPQCAAASEESLNSLGYELLFRGECAAAVEVFEENSRAWPRSANAQDSLAEACARSGDPVRAVEGYRRALALEPEYPNAEEALRFLGAHAADVP